MKVYLLDGSYREMTEWALPTEQQVEYDHLAHEMEHDSRWPRIRKFVRGGFWRNFKVKYPEADEMYSRMMHISGRLDQALQANPHGELLERAREELYRAQCNCGYWHGAFGGIYLACNAVYQHLIAADNLLTATPDERRLGRPAEDYNFDSRQGSRWPTTSSRPFAPGRGGQSTSSTRSICHNLLATLARMSLTTTWPEPKAATVRWQAS